MMNQYVNLINSTLDYIEENIFAQLTLSGISERFFLSEYHFDRLFKVFVGKSLKQYILGRKLTLSLDRLRNSKDSILDIAMDFGFEYPEVFSRAFKKQFGVAPRIYRTKKPKVDMVAKGSVIPRDLINFQGGLTLKASYSHLETTILWGVSVDVDVNKNGFESVLKTTGERFLADSAANDYLEHNEFYSLVNCHGDGSGMHTVFFGKKAKGDKLAADFSRRPIPGGWYASFAYQGDMLELRSTFVDDLFRWIAFKEIELECNGIGMLTVYDKDYLENQSIRILVPIKKPK